MSNLYAQIKELFAPARVQVATVSAYADGVATLELPGSGQIRARGQVAAVGQKVFVQDGVIQGPAPDLPVLVDEI